MPVIVNFMLDLKFHLTSSPDAAIACVSVIIIVVVYIAATNNENYVQLVYMYACVIVAFVLNFTCIYILYLSRYSQREDASALGQFYVITINTLNSSFFFV